MTDIAINLTAMLGRLCLAVGAYVTAQARGPQLVWLGTRAFAPITPPDRLPALPAETWLLLTHRINRLAQRFRTLFALYQAGTLSASRPPRAAPPSPRAPYPRLPTARGWINGRIPATAPCAGTLEFMLHTPELRQFVSATPQAGRLLRPLCHMLAIAIPDYLRLPPHPKPCFSPLALGRREPEGGSSIAEPNSAPPVAQGTPDRPIPRNILAAARAWRRKTPPITQ